MLTRRSFLRDIGTGLLVAAAPAVVLAEPERKQWFVGRGAPVGSRTDGWYEFVSSRAVTWQRDEDGLVDPASSLLDRHGELLGLQRTPGESDRELLARLVERYQQYLNVASNTSLKWLSCWP
jgi:hypothetical protein